MSKAIRPREEHRHGQGAKRITVMSRAARDAGGGLEEWPRGGVPEWMQQRIVSASAV